MLERIVAETNMVAKQTTPKTIKSLIQLLLFLETSNPHLRRDRSLPEVDPVLLKVIHVGINSSFKFRRLTIRGKKS
jgi:hypothetical protein